MTTSPSERIVCDLGGKTDCRLAARLAAAESALTETERERDVRRGQNVYLYDQWGLRIAHCANAEPHKWHGWVAGNEDLRCPGTPEQIAVARARLDAQDETLRRIRDNARSWHGPPVKTSDNAHAGHEAALRVIAEWVDAALAVPATAEEPCDCVNGEVPATPGQPGDGPMPCPRCQPAAAVPSAAPDTGETR